MAISQCQQWVNHQFNHCEFNVLVAVAAAAAAAVVSASEHSARLAPRDPNTRRYDGVLHVIEEPKTPGEGRRG